jgi:hypothetical protein
LTSNIEDLKKYFTKPLQYLLSPPLPIPGTVGDLFLIIDDPDEFNTFAYNSYIANPDTFEVGQFWNPINNGNLCNYYSNFETEYSFASNISQYLNGYAKQSGNSIFHYIKKENVSLRLAFDVGKFLHFPTARYYTNNLHLNFWDEKGLFKTYWKQFTEWYFNIPYELEKKISFSVFDLKTIDFTKKYLINKHLYFIDSIKVVIKLDGTVEPATVKLMPYLS